MIPFLSLFLHFGLMATTAQMTGVPGGIWRSGGRADGAWEYQAEFYQKNGRLHAKVIQLGPLATIQHCHACAPPHQGKPLQEMDILWDLRNENGMWKNGKILNPENGKVYDCQLSLEPGGKIAIRAYIKMPLFGRTIFWESVKTEAGKQ